MRRLLVTATACWCLAGPAQAIDAQALPYLWQLGVKVAEWVQVDAKKLYYVEVTAHGPDFEQAREQAFRVAVERAVGAVISSQTETQDQTLVRDNIIVYSSGFVENYQVIERIGLGHGQRVRMRVWVSHSRLSNRLLSESRGEAQVPGSQITAQISSYRHQQTQGDQLLESVLADLPQQGFDVRVHRTRVTVDHRRNTTLEVPITVAWNQHYLNSLREAFERTTAHADCVGTVLTWSGQRRCRARSSVFFGQHRVVSGFDDDVRLEMLSRHLNESRLALRLKIRHSTGQEIFSDCYLFDPNPHNMFWVAGNVMIRDSVKFDTRLLVNLNQVSVDQADQAEVRVVDIDQCRR